mgnify:CR=1 FL=1
MVDWLWLSSGSTNLELILAQRKIETVVMAGSLVGRGFRDGFLRTEFGVWGMGLKSWFLGKWCAVRVRAQFRARVARPTARCYPQRGAACYQSSQPTRCRPVPPCAADQLLRGVQHADGL